MITLILCIISFAAGVYRDAISEKAKALYIKYCSKQ